jgi:hypothetical protein
MVSAAGGVAVMARHAPAGALAEARSLEACAPLCDEGDDLAFADALFDLDLATLLAEQPDWGDADDASAMGADAARQAGAAWSGVSASASEGASEPASAPESALQLHRCLDAKHAQPCALCSPAPAENEEGACAARLACLRARLPTCAAPRRLLLTRHRTRASGDYELVGESGKKNGEKRTHAQRSAASCTHAPALTRH